MKKLIACVTAGVLLATTSAPAWASYQSTLAEARNDYSAGQYQSAYNVLRAYRRSQPGTLAMDDLLAISACAIVNLRQSGLQLLRQLPATYTPLSSANANLINQQIAICSRTSPNRQVIAMMTAGSGSTSASVQNLQSQRSEALRRAITDMPLAVPKVQVKPGIAP